MAFKYLKQEEDFYNMKSKKNIIYILMAVIALTIGAVVIISYSLKKEKYYKDYDKHIQDILADDKEIERKWIVEKEKIPFNIEETEKIQIEQTYICFSPEIRVRKLNNGESHSFAVKTNMTADGLMRNEIEEYITEEEYNILIKKKEGNTIYKTRYQFLHEDNIYSIDIFEEDLKGLAYLEVEFTTKEKARNFEKPEWAGEEVTSDVRYKNGYLARYGIPEK